MVYQLAGGFVLEVDCVGRASDELEPWYDTTLIAPNGERVVIAQDTLRGDLEIASYQSMTPTELEARARRSRLWENWLHPALGVVAAGIFLVLALLMLNR